MNNPKVDPVAPGDGPRSDQLPLPLVLFDGGCPLCRREIDHYRRLRGADLVQWIDVNTTTNLHWLYGVDTETAMRRFHVRTADGDWVTGAYAFAELWSHLRGYRLAAAAVRQLHLLPLLDWAYRRFADWRFERRRCSDRRCAVSSQTHPDGGLSE